MMILIGMLLGVANLIVFGYGWFYQHAFWWWNLGAGLLCCMAAIITTNKEE